MRRRSYIYEEIISFLIAQNLINESFYANQIVLNRGKTIVSFIYKHSNLEYKDIWTLFFIRIPNSKPMQFTVDLDLLMQYETKFQLKYIIN
jgi:hypothetical protein